MPNYGYTDSAYWVRLPLQNPTSSPVNRVLDIGFANMHFVDLYTPAEEDGEYVAIETGALRPPATRDVPHPADCFRRQHAAQQ